MHLDRSLYLITGNLHKVEEFSRLLPQHRFLSLQDHPLPHEPIENGKTFTENSLIKSLAGLQNALVHQLNVLALADDSGLEVDALDGAPGVMSARFAPGSDVDRYQALLTALKAVGADHPQHRMARFRCVLSLSGLTQADEDRLWANPDIAQQLQQGHALSFHRQQFTDHIFRSVCALGTFEGSIALSPSGQDGFGYDPIFIPQNYQVSVATLDPKEKDALSHRGKALALLKPVLSCLCS